MDLKGNLELQPPPLPIVLDFWNKDLDEIGNFPRNSAEFARKLESMAEPRLRKKSATAMPKILHFSCFVTLLLVSRLNSPSLPEIMSQSSASIGALQVLLRQDFTLGLETPWYQEKGISAYSGLPAKFFPQSIVVISDLPVRAGHSELSLLDLMLFRFSADLPTIVLISIGSMGLQYGQTEKDEFGTAIFFCWYCEESERFQAVGNFKTAVSAAELKASECAAKVPWLGSNALPRRNPHGELCPFSLAIEKAETCAKEEENVESIVLENLNSTMVRSRILNMAFPVGRIPKLFSVPATFADAEIVAPIQNSGFGLITSDGMETASERGYFSPLVQPLSRTIWIVAASSIVVVTIVITGLRWSSVNHRKFAKSIYSVAVVLLDQPRKILPAAHIGLDAKSNDTLSTGIKLISALWLLSVLVLTTSYKAEYKTNYVIETVYNRSWTSKLLDMNDFSIFIGIEEIEIRKSELQDAHYLPSRVCDYSDEKYVTLSHDPRRSCALLLRFTQIKLGEMTHLSYEIRRQKMAQLENRIHLVPMTYMKQVIQKYLTAPKTVFVSPLQFFDADWNYFREAMRLDRKRKFTRHHDNEDTTLKADSVYGFTKGLHAWHKNSIPRRLKGVASSGIWGLWLKWKNLRLKVYASRKASLGHFGYLPLTFSGSDISLVFALFGICVCTCLVTLFTELFYCFVWKSGSGTRITFM